MQSLNCVLQCRTIDFLENVAANLNHVVRSHCHEESIKGRMM